MSLLTSTRIFILLSLCLSTQSTGLLNADNQHSGNELGVDRCSHQHFLIVDKFFVDSIWRHIEAPQHNYKYVQCSREAHVGSKLREYKFAVEMGEVECNFTFKVHDVNTEETLKEINALEVNDINKCKQAIHTRYPVVESKPNLIKADEIETSNLHPLFSDIPEDEIETSNLHPLFSDIPETDGDDEEMKEMFKNSLSFGTGAKKVGNESNDDRSDSVDESKPTLIDLKKDENEPDYDLSDTFDESNVDWTGPHRKVADIDIEEQDSELVEQKRLNRANTQAPAQKINLISTEEPELITEHVMVGGYSKCDIEILKNIPTLFTILANKNVLKGFKLYLENITECKTQVVNGVNYKITTSINEEVCSYVLYQTTDGDVSVSSHLSDVPACRAYLTKQFASENPALV